MNPPGLYAGAPYHYAAIAEGEPHGVRRRRLPDRRGRGGVPGGIEAQAGKAVENLFAALSAAGAAPGDVLKTTVYVASSEQPDLVRAWEVIAAAFAPARPPSTLLGVAVLGYTGQLVEIEAIALAS